MWQEGTKVKKGESFKKSQEKQLIFENLLETTFQEIKRVAAKLNLLIKLLEMSEMV